MKHVILATVSAMIMANAVAATTTCPPIQSITQTQMATGGYRYEASEPDGRLWKDESPLASASYLADSTFHNAQYDVETEAVICTYRGPMGNDASFSVTLKPVSGWNLTPAAGYWRGTYCEHPEVSKCEFSHQ
ncbi:hypothetical protein [Pseudomonas sp. AMR01]|uniref:hypothetical protein n=1 Tax=Pseudomonas sp. AMR01 TaxID=3064904 RepID=UPI0035BF7F92